MMDGNDYGRFHRVVNSRQVTVFDFAKKAGLPIAAQIDSKNEYAADTPTVCVLIGRNTAQYLRCFLPAHWQLLARLVIRYKEH